MRTCNLQEKSGEKMSDISVSSALIVNHGLLVLPSSMSVATPTLIPREPIFPRLLPSAPQTQVLSLPKSNPTDPPGSYTHLNAWRNLQREMDDLSEEESELEDLVRSFDGVSVLIGFLMV